jgi:hypothetical protein
MEECRYKNLLNFLSSSIKVAAEWRHEWKMDGFLSLSIKVAAEWQHFYIFWPIIKVICKLKIQNRKLSSSSKYIMYPNWW